ncbi:hypothetical protein CLAFUW4_14219 [Fulvia fulva]|uniref:Uncharacterized protein n=1 Tax=Passalora fulva TaxID=5499 RepID=A0A9Q8PL12_PASFU|nr:uncharacterized protein CLAFUR5_14052 [Fulvia fulva]KAK4610519.1 hypothetical protein CLAFUR4_14222 [Fulvia fulva]KAK4611176.1 hypothetical protein CLAFUR0_14227 [Fulvia fulva]UJO24584.1 hypothetical protein CLAFUR5_14052 [Fulvia fulva]WPV22016.1 hypothetical protein CLAFUW4_14219 [Fulvia fulva]WPV36935.1 hypothetical protein CLAFUW7_14230 [Fulvia fulva]
MSSRFYRESFEEYLQSKSPGASTTFGKVPLSHDFDHVLQGLSISSPNQQITASLPRNFRDALRNDYRPNDSRVGIIAKLPQKQQLQHAGSVVLSQPHVNDGAFGHPCLTLGTSPDGRLVFCAQMTSFGGRDLREKQVYSPSRV